MTDRPVYIGLQSASKPIELPPREPSSQWGTFTHAVLLPSADAGLAVRLGASPKTIDERRAHSRRAYGRKRR